MEVIQISKEEFIKLTKEIVEEVIKKEMPNILKEAFLSIIPEDEPEEDEIDYVEEEIREEDYISLKEVLEKYGSESS